MAVIKLHRSAHRKTDVKPGDVPLNSGEGLRAAYYVEDDPASYSSLKQHISQIDLLFPEWLHVITPDGKLNAYAQDNSPYAVIDHGTVRQVDREAKVARTVAANHVNLDIFPLVNNYDPKKGLWVPEVGAFFSNEAARTNFLQQVHTFLAANPSYRGLSIDFEEIPTSAQPGFQGADRRAVRRSPSAQSAALCEHAGRRRRLGSEVHGGPLRRSAVDEL